MSYATDGICHHAEHGTFGHECGKPATWIGEKEGGYRMGFCDRCQPSGTRFGFTRWWRISEQHMTPTTHERAEWARMALAAYRVGRNDIGHRYSVAAAQYAPLTCAQYDTLATPFRRWLIDNVFPDEVAL